MIHKETFAQDLAKSDPQLLQQVLTSSGIYVPKDATSDKMSELIANHVWKRSHTPVRNIVAPRTLENIIQIYAKKLSLSIDNGVDAYEQLEALRSQLLDTDAVISVADIPDDIKEQLTRSLWPRLAGVGGAGTAAGSRWAARKVLELTNSKWLDIIKLIPKVGPGLIAVRTIASTVATVSAPIGIALSLWTLNENFGPQWDRCLTLLVGSALCLQSQNSDSKKFPKSPSV